jgi:hypothetical protein
VAAQQQGTKVRSRRYALRWERLLAITARTRLETESVVRNGAFMDLPLQTIINNINRINLPHSAT